MSSEWGYTTIGAEENLHQQQAAWQTHTSPNIGPQTLDYLQTYVHGYTSATVRIAIFTAEGSFIAQTAEKSFSGSGWVGDTAFLDIDKAPMANPDITGSTNYILCSAMGGVTSRLLDDPVGTNSAWIDSVTFASDGFGPSLPIGTPINWSWSIKAGSTAKSGGGNIGMMRLYGIPGATPNLTW